MQLREREPSEQWGVKLERTVRESKCRQESVNRRLSIAKLLEDIVCATLLD